MCFKFSLNKLLSDFTETWLRVRPSICQNFSLYGGHFTVHNGYKLGKKLYEGKTKQVFDLPEMPDHVLLLNKDRITAGDGARAHDLEGKADISNQTNGKVFGILNAAGKENSNSFYGKC